MSAELLTVKRAALEVGVSSTLIYGWIGDGLLPHYRLGKSGSRGAIRIKEADLLAFIESLRHDVQAPRPVKAKRAEKLKHLRLA